MLGQEGAAPRQDTQAGARPAFFISNFRTVLFSLYFFRTGKREKCLSDDCDFLADHTEPAAVTDPVGAVVYCGWILPGLIAWITAISTKSGQAVAR
jgi:hypothetical protein